MLPKGFTIDPIMQVHLHHHGMTTAPFMDWVVGIRHRPLGLEEGGVQIIYRIGNWGVSIVDSPALHMDPFAWEALIVEWRPDEEGYGDGPWDFTTFTRYHPWTESGDIKVFDTDREMVLWLGDTLAQMSYRRIAVVRWWDALVGGIKGLVNRAKVRWW